MRGSHTTLSTQIRQTLTGKKCENYNPTHLGLPNLNRHCFFRNRRWSIYLRYLEGQRFGPRGPTRPRSSKLVVVQSDSLGGSNFVLC